MFYELKIHRNIRTFIIFSIALLILLGAYTVFAQDHSAIDYPVAELGNCENEQECRSYCDSVAHFQQCIAFAKANDLLTVEELAEAKRFQQFGVESGPGGCVSESECKAYCENISHITECLDFAEQHDILDSHELAEARRIAAALQGGATLPGGCQNKAQCEAYCEEPVNINECLDFAEAAGFLSPEELEEARRIAPFMARGEMPGGCRSREECEAYCSESGNTDECATFFEAAGFITPEEAAMFRRTGGKGPGGCQGERECETFCNSPEHQQECFEFAREHGIISEDEIHNIEEGLAQFREGLQNATLEVAQCLKDAIGEDVLLKIEDGTFLPNQDIGEHMRGCFQEHASDIIEHEIQKSLGGDVPPGAVECIQRIVGNAAGPTTPEQEQKIAQECFSAAFPSEGIHDGFEGEFEQRQTEEFERQFEEEFQKQFEQQFQQEFQRQLEEQKSGGFEIPEEFQEFLQEPIFPEIELQSTEEEIHTEARVPREGFFGAVVDAMAPALKRFLPFLPL